MGKAPVPATNRRIAATPVDAVCHQRRPGLSIQNRDWGDNKRLDLVVIPEVYTTWRDRALGHLAKDRPDVRRLLLWAERLTGGD